MTDDALAHARKYLAHDLLRLRALPVMDDMPAWLPLAFADAPFAVVRRAQAPSGYVPVGFRGALRAQRYAGFVAHELIEGALSPEHLLERPIPAGRSTLKAFSALQAIVEQRYLGALLWGPTGSVGFELAARQPTATATSDLDLLLRTPSRLPRSNASAMRQQLRRLEEAIDVRIDVQLETPLGGVALSEWADDKSRVMVRSAHGPSLVPDPWAADDAPTEARR